VRFPAAAALALAGLAGGCGKPAGPEVRVFAASSLTDVLGALAPLYEGETGTKVVLDVASSSTLARQIVEGAPCDLFLSADEEWADYVERDGWGNMADKEPFLTNGLVLVLADGVDGDPWDTPRGLEPPAAAGDEAIRRALAPGPRALGREVKRIAVGDPAHVPAGRYARRGLENLGIWEECRGRLIPCDSVRSALALVLSGEADAGIVYRSDALAAASVHAVPPNPFPEAGTAPLPGVEARYMSVTFLKSEDGPRFLAWLREPARKAVFRAAGFGIPGEDR